MIDPVSFKNVRLTGGFVITEVEFAHAPIEDALGREAVAQTTIVGSRFHIRLLAGLSDLELSISLYHEVLEAAAVASLHPPESVTNFNEADFERAAQAMHAELGDASLEKLNHMLQSYGFREE
jgi:hypothetical protein